MWLLLPTALAVDVCQSGCAYQTLQQAIDAGEGELELVDDADYAGFTYVGQDSVRVRRSGAARIVGPTLSLIPLIQVDGGLVEIEDVPLLGSVGPPTLYVTGGAELILRDVAVDCRQAEGLLFGGGVVVVGGGLSVDGGSFERCWSPLWGGAVWAESATVDLRGVRFADNGASLAGGGLYALASDVSIGDGVSFVGNTSVFDGGGALAVVQSTLEVDGQDLLLDGTGGWVGGALALSFTEVLGPIRGLVARGNASGLDGGAIWASDTTLDLEAPTLEDNTCGTSGYTCAGGALYFQGPTADLDLSDAVLLGNTGDWGHGLRVVDARAVRVDGGRWEGGTYGYAGVLLSVDGASALQVEGTTFAGATAYTPGGAVSARDVGEVSILGSSFLGNRAVGAGGVSLELVRSALLARNLYCGVGNGAIEVFGGCAGPGSCVIANERIHGVSSELADGGGALMVGEGAVVTASHLTIVEPSGAPSVADVWGSASLTLERSVVHGADGAPFSVGAGSQLVTSEVNLDPTSTQPGSRATGVTGHPTFRLGSADPATLDCGVEFRLHPDSLVEGLGAYHGPERDEQRWLTDGDGDGVPWAHDCDDLDAPTTGGTLPEICANEVDDDCDGALDEVDENTIELEWSLDADGDGWGGPTSEDCDPPAGAVLDPERFGDCDDADASAYPGALDVVDDGIDQDCDGFEAGSFVLGGGCGCRSSVPRGGGLLALLARRRPHRP